MDSTTSHSTTRHGGIAIGIGAPLAGAWATPQNLTRFARQAESLGYRSLWTFQRLFVPDGSDMPPVYRSVLDPLVSLGYAAAVTSTVRLGVAVLNHPFASPLLMAKQAATVDVLSGGRLDLGLGIGWLAEEFTGSGAVMSQRGPRTTEYVAALRALWSADGVTQFSGEHYEIPAGRQDPPPVQGQGTGRPGPPVILGGMSRPSAIERGRADRGRLGHGERRQPFADRLVRGPGPGDGRRPRARPPADHLPGRGAPRCRGHVTADGRAAATVRKLPRADPRRCRVAGVSGRDRGLLRPELGPRDR